MAKIWNSNCIYSGNLILISIKYKFLNFLFLYFVKKRKKTMNEREKELKVKINIPKNWDLNCTLMETYGMMILKFNFN